MKTHYHISSGMKLMIWYKQGVLVQLIFCKSLHRIY